MSLKNSFLAEYLSNLSKEDKMYKILDRLSQKCKNCACVTIQISYTKTNEGKEDNQYKINVYNKIEEKSGIPPKYRYIYQSHYYKDNGKYIGRTSNKYCNELPNLEKSVQSEL